MKKRNIIIVSVISAVFIVGIIAGSVFAMLESSFSFSTGTVLKSDNGTVFLIKNNSPVRLGDYTEEGKLLAGLETGDKILVLHDGIAESYPASTSARFVIKTGDGGEGSIPEEVVSSLSELGWISDDKTAVSEDVPFEAEYIRTGTPGKGTTGTTVTVMNSLPELQLYIRENKEALSLTDEFLGKTQKYDDEFFVKNSLILLFVTEGSGSVSHRIESVKKTGDKKLEVTLLREVPEAGTCDMAYHHIIAEVKKEDLGERDILLDGITEQEAYEEVSVSTGKEGMSFIIPDSWGCRKEESEILPLSIELYNKNEPDKIITAEFTGAFGVCGTGLRTESIKVGGYDAVKGIYDGNPVWDFISIDLGEDYVVFYNHSDSIWWQEYGDDAMEILDTLKINR